MNNKHFSIALGVVATSIFLALLPYLLHDFFKEDVGLLKRLGYLAIPLIVGIMWHQIVKLVRNGNTHNSGKPENQNAQV